MPKKPRMFRLNVDPVGEIDFLRRRGYSYARIAREFPMWPERRKTPLTAEELEAYHTEHAPETKKVLRKTIGKRRKK
jgi:hypothetical protein